MYRVERITLHSCTSYVFKPNPNHTPTLTALLTPRQLYETEMKAKDEVVRADRVVQAVQVAVGYEVHEGCCVCWGC